MELKDILDMEEYLKNRCYCPGEIYSADGFFYQIFEATSECKVVGERNDNTHNFIAVISTPKSFNDKETKAQIIVIFRSKDLTMVEDCVRYDATNNNIKLVKEIIACKKDRGNFDEYEKGSTAKSLKEIFSIADAIMID